MRRRGFTLVEVLIGVGISTVLIGIVYGILYFFFFSRSRSNVVGLTRRSFIQKDAKAGLRHLVYRIREGTQILDPVPGTTGSTLEFRDIQNARVRIRHIAAQKKVISEKQSGGTWTQEVNPVVKAAALEQVPVSWPVTVASCTAIRFTVMTPGSVVIEASIENEGMIGSLLTLVKLQNTGEAN